MAFNLRTIGFILGHFSTNTDSATSLLNLSLASLFICMESM